MRRRLSKRTPHVESSGREEEGDERLACSAISFFTLLSPSGLSSEESWAGERSIVIYGQVP